MITFEEKVVNFQRENEEVQSLIIRGSDEHLDMLLSIKNDLDPFTERFSNFLTELIPEANDMSESDVQKVLPALLDLYASCIKLVAVLKRSGIGQDIKSSAQNYYSQIDSLREFIFDLETFRISDNDELDSILLELNNL